MKTITPDMRLDKQVIKGIVAVNMAIDQNNLKKASYTIHLIQQMVDSATLNGQPRPWSEFSPLIAKEFD